MKKIIDGKLVSEEDVVQTHARLVHFTVKKHGYERSLIEYDDLISIGMIGLIKAFRNYDESYGTKFSTYAVAKIKGELLRSIRDSHQVTGLKFPRKSKEIAMLIINKELEECPLPIIVETLNESIKDIKLSLDFISYGTTVSLENEISDNSNKKRTFHDVVGVEDDYSMIEFADFIKTLTKLERQVMELRSRELKQAEIAATVGCHQVNVSRILAVIKSKYNVWSDQDAAS